MKYLPLVLAALTRRKLRTILTLLSVTVAFTLFGLLMGTDASFRRMAAATNPKVLEIESRFGGNFTDAIGQQIAALPNVAAVSATASVFGYYRDPKTLAYAIMVDNEAGWPNAPLSPAQWAEWRAKPDGIFISHIAAKAWDLKKGDIFTIIDSRTPRADGGNAWRFQVLDVLDDTPYRPAGFSYGSYQYYKLSRPAADQAKPGYFQAVVTDASRADDTALAIDAHFANSAVATRSNPIFRERSDAATALVNVASVTRRVALVGLFMILMLTGHGMAQSVRERLGEFAVLKTIGYSDAVVIALVFAEALTPLLLGAMLGLGAAALLDADIQSLLADHGFYLPLAYLPPAVIGEALAAAALLAFLSVVLPAQKLRRMDVAAILAGRA